MNKYIKPEYNILVLQANDVITTSGFEINQDNNNNKVDYIINPGSIFGF